MSTGDVVQPGGGGTQPNPLQRFYTSHAFDLVCGAVPGALLGVYSLFIGGFLIYSVLREGLPDNLFGLLMALSTLGGLACIALLVSTFARARLSASWRTVCTVFLTLGILVALISLAVLAVIILPLGRDAPWFLVPLALGVSLSLAAFKQIRLLSSGGDGAVLRR